ncbi:MAG TPA: fluoride efflux transporter CrcB [Dehalococcoidia bacterium]|nr:fluoride efflux transporter CrcB [Dehalococcoidia bacterium]
MNLVYVILGAMVGAPARYLLGTAITDANWGRFPYGTLAVNITGCLAIGIVGTLVVEKAALSREARLLIITGFLGSYTTFSAFGFETFELIRSGDVSRALVNAIGSVVVGVLAVWAGAAIAKVAWA